MIRATKVSITHRRAIFIVASVLFLAFGLNRALAQDQQAGQGLEISPPLVDISSDPGKTVKFEITLRNVTSSTLIAKPSVDDFIAEGEEGQPKLLLDDNGEPNPYSISEWVKPIADLRLEPQKAETAHITMNIPSDASPGGHYGVIRFTAVPPELEDSGVSLSASIGSLVLVKISGEVVEKAVFEEFYTSAGEQRKSLFENGPITFVQRIKNEGNTHIKPHGTVRVTNMLGKEVGVLTINENGGNVLPGSIRRFAQEMPNKWMFGRYKAEANVQFSGQNINSNLTFWVIPYKLIAIIAGIAIVLIIVLRYLLRAYGRRAVEKAHQSKSAPKKSVKPKKK